ncbi:MAG: HemK2/MTQ2 family protein methyltransferase [Thermoplasmatota archaeon]
MSTVFEYEGLRYFEAEGVYPVREDTLLLISVLKDQLQDGKGRLLDMGAGTGLASLTASSMGWGVVSVDREPLALSLVRRNLKMNGLASELYLSDLFEGLPRRFLSAFDLMTFNPPYLEVMDPWVDRRSDLALVGGYEGTNVLERFIRNCRPFLARDGRIIVLGYSNWKIGRFLEGCGLDLRKGPLIEKDIDGELFRAYILEAGQ